jgi:hypothetical protein
VDRHTQGFLKHGHSGTRGSCGETGFACFGQQSNDAKVRDLYTTTKLLLSFVILQMNPVLLAFYEHKRKQLKKLTQLRNNMRRISSQSRLSPPGLGAQEEQDDDAYESYAITSLATDGTYLRLRSPLLDDITVFDLRLQPS